MHCTLKLCQIKKLCISGKQIFILFELFYSSLFSNSRCFGGSTLRPSSGGILLNLMPKHLFRPLVWIVLVSRAIPFLVIWVSVINILVIKLQFLFTSAMSRYWNNNSLGQLTRNVTGLLQTNFKSTVILLKKWDNFNRDM